jgi:dethiobiotin synthetase
MNHSYFVTATGTGVGKTMVSALIAATLRARGIDAGVMKPFATGCYRQNGELICDDAEFLREATGVEDEMELICPARWEEPLAPLVAAQRAGNAQKPWLTIVHEAHEELRRRHDCVIVEGVGGWMVPVGEHNGRIVTVEDFASGLGLPVVLVAGRGLGTISHTLLSARSIQACCELSALVFCDAEPQDESDVAVQTSAEWLCKYLGQPLRHIEFEPHLRPQRVRALAHELNWNWL